MSSNNDPLDEPLITVGQALSNPLARGMYRIVGKPFEQLLSISALNRMFARTRGQCPTGDYFANALRMLNVRYDLSPEDMAKIPPVGPLVLVANHPFGAVDGLIMGDILSRIRPDARLLANRLLGRIPELKPWIFPVDPFGNHASVQKNASSLRLAMKWVKQGGAIGMFPAGTVSHLQLGQGCVADPAWHAALGCLVRHAGATVVTLFFDGRNSMVFQLSGLLHPALRTVLLPSELLKRRDSYVSVRIGRPIDPHKWARYKDDRTLAEYLRFKTYMLKWRESPVRPRFPTDGPTVKATLIAKPDTANYLAREIASLPKDAELLQQGDYRVFLASAEHIPSILQEIGRLREITFRAVEEGTGRDRDLDRFDGHYLHIFLWNEARQEIVGSYRIGRVDDILANMGPSGLYTHTLFKFAAGFLQGLGPALELGRSFVRAEYQTKAAPIALIWRGIGEFLVRHPEYKLLFGPVSISRSYHGLSRRLMVDYLTRHYGHVVLSARVKPRNPPKDRLARMERESLSGLIRDADDLSALISEIETDCKGVPTLLRQYLRLNASLLSFNVDAAFGHCLDGLILVDLRTSDPNLLKRFMGERGYARYAAVPGPHHSWREKKPVA